MLDCFNLVHDYGAQTVFNNKTFIGRGFSQSKEKAVEKALSEVFERMLLVNSELSHCHKTTSGMAVHTDLNSAVRNATLELIERDLFFCHYLTQTPFIDISDSKILLQVLEYQEFLAFAKNKGITVKIALVYESLEFYSVLCCAIGFFATPAFGMCLGMGTKSSFNDALQHGILECASGLFGVIKSSPNDISNYFISYESFLQLSPVLPEYHLRHWLQPGSEQRILNLFDKNRLRKTLYSSDIFFENMHAAEIVLPDWCSDCPIHVVVAENPDLQQLYFGTTSPCCVNLSRLSGFCNKLITYEQLELYPHPFS